MKNDRRDWLRRAGGLALGGALGPLLGAGLSACGGSGGGSDSGDGRDSSASDQDSGSTSTSTSTSSTDTTTYPAPSSPKARVVEVGGGMAGATAAKYLRMWGDAVDVTLVDRSASYTSCIMSSLVLTGQRSLASQDQSRAALRDRYGVKLVVDEVMAVDPVAARITLAGGSVLSADRIVLAPGLSFDATPGLDNPDRMPHAWKAGPQTGLLAQQLQALPDGGVVALTIPKAPYRCPPGPYERACLIADWLKQNRPRAKLLVLDANPDFVTEKDNFSSAFYGLHAGVIDYHTNVAIERVDPASNTLVTNGGNFRADVVNLIPPQRAPAWLLAAGLLNDSGSRFAKVNVLDYGSTAAPRVHVIGDACATTQPKAGHIANQQAKVLADALARTFAGGQPDPAPVTTSACYSTITMAQASWLHTLFQYDPASAQMLAVAAASGASAGWSSGHFREMGTWFNALMADSFA